MSNKRFSQIANRFPVSARPVLVALAAFVALATFASLLLLLGPGPAAAVAAPVEEPQIAVGSPAPVVIAATMAPTTTTTTILQHTPDPSLVGDPIWVEFQVVPNTIIGVSVDGTIVVSDGTATCSRTVDSGTPGHPYPDGWRWSCNLTPTSAGAKTLTATFTPGIAAYATSTSAGVLHQVDAATDVTIGISFSPALPVYGETVTLTATIVPSTCTGIVFFDDGGTEIGRATLDGGTATVETFTLGAGPHRVKAVYLGSDHCSESESAELDLDVAKASTYATLTSSPPINAGTEKPEYGQDVTFTAIVSPTVLPPTRPGATTPTGFVTFRLVSATGPAIGQGLLNGEGVATLTMAELAVGTYNVVAVYEGDANYNTSNDTLSQTVYKAETTTVLTRDPSPSSVYGESVTFTAEVNRTNPGIGAPTGKVKFTGWGDDFEARLAEGETAFTPREPIDASGTPYTIKAEYLGNDNFATSYQEVDHTVNKAETSTTLHVSLPESSRGQEVTLTATVGTEAPGVGTPEGDVTFYEDSTPLGTETLENGQASLATSDLAVGDPDLKAVYCEPDNCTNFKTSEDTVTHTVNPAPTITFLTSSANPSVYGQSVTFTASVTTTGSGIFAGEPTGTVAFKDGGTTIGTETLVGGVATLTKSDLSVGSHSITAEFTDPAGDFADNTSATLTQRVDKANTTTTLTSSHSPGNTSVVGEEVTFTADVAAVAPGAGTPTGTVHFMDGAKEIGTGTLASTATFTTSGLAAGQHYITAIYGGDGKFNGSNSAALIHTVGTVDTTTTLANAPDPSVFGQTVTFTATVTATAAIPITPTGLVTLKIGGTLLDTQALSVTGQAVLTTCAIPVGIDQTIRADYGGDASFNSSFTTTLQTVNPATTTTTIDSVDPFSPTVVGEPVLVNFTVTPPGCGTPTGNVTVSDGTDSCVGTVASAGSCTLVPTTAGLKTLRANYAGDGNFNGNPPGTGTRLHQVNPASTTTTVTSDPNPSLSGSSVAINATVTANPPGSGTPTGNVAFKDGGVMIAGCSSVALSGGSATCNTTALVVLGLHTLSAEYNNVDGNFNDSDNSTTHNVSDNPTDLSVTKADSPDPVNAGHSLTYLVNVTNHGPLSTTVTLTDMLPPEVTFVSATPSQGNCNEAGGTVTCDLGSMASGGSATVTVVVNVPLTTPAGTVLRNTAQVGGTRPEPDPDPHPNTTIEETTVYRVFTSGDCNGDDAVTLADIWSIVRDIFDPTYEGTTGCDANKDRRVDAGDVPSTVLIMLEGLNAGGMGGDLNTATEGPTLTLPDQVPAVPSGLVTLPVSFAANGHSITSLVFSVDYDETWLALDPTDRDGNGIPDAVIFSLPGEFSYSVAFNGDDADGEVDIFIGDISPPLTSLSDGPIVFMILNVDSSPGETQRAVRFSLDPEASFGDTSGWSVPGTATPTGRYPYQIYLPVLH